MQPLRAGVLRHRIEIRRAIEVENERGGFTTEFSRLGYARAEVIGQDGKEAMLERVLQGISTYRIRIRWRADILEKDQLRSAGSCFRGKEVNIRSIVDPDGKREQLVIIADTASILPAQP